MRSIIRLPAVLCLLIFVGSFSSGYGGVRKVCDTSTIPGYTTAGCAKGVEGGWPSPSHRYNVYYSDSVCIPQHEACHALYEQWNHTIAFDIRQAMGSMFASCPGGRRMSNRSR